MDYTWKQPASQGLPWALRREWLETNGLGDYASSSLLCCNTRKYHGLFTLRLKPGQGRAGRYVLLSTLEETLLAAGQELPMSCRKHPGVFYPSGHEYLDQVSLGERPHFLYSFTRDKRCFQVSRELMLASGRRFLLVRYVLGVSGGGRGAPPCRLRIRPLLAFRNFHELTHANAAIDTAIRLEAGGFSVRPRLDLPALFFQVGTKEPGPDLPETDMPETDLPETDEPETDLPETDEPETDGLAMARPAMARPATSGLAANGSGPGASRTGRSGDRVRFVRESDWYYNCEYEREAERGFASSEDLFMPGSLTLRLAPGKPVFLVVGTEAFKTAFPGRTKTMPRVWRDECGKRAAAKEPAANQAANQAVNLAGGQAAKLAANQAANLAVNLAGGLAANLAWEGSRFIIREPGAAPDRAGNILAGYHWFGAWGRDTLISLAGLTWGAGRDKAGLAILKSVGEACKEGLIPNIFSLDGNHAYNSADASLWYLRAVQQAEAEAEGGREFVRQHCLPVIRQIIDFYASGRIPHVRIDRSGFLHVGGPETQLTWMDAMVDGKPVTPRNGCPVEINALWYNGLVFAAGLDKSGKQPLPADLVAAMPAEFSRRFLVSGKQGRYLADVWTEDGPDARLRPNQLFAVGLPFAVLEGDGRGDVLKAVQEHLLTPYGLRSLAPFDPAYCGLYRGGPSSRDSAYHQGTVWPWLLGIYGDALMKTSSDREKDAAGLLETITPLLTAHLCDAGIGSISEIFSGDPPHEPDGCIAQAWSVGEVFRLLCRLKKDAPGAYGRWESLNAGRGRCGS